MQADPEEEAASGMGQEGAKAPQTSHGSETDRQTGPRRALPQFLTSAQNQELNKIVV